MNDVVWVVRLWLRVTMVMTAVALLLSLAGIYAVLSFTVARRTREIGLRVALGANPRRVIGAIFRRPLWQVGFGVLAGIALITLAGSVETEMPGMNGELSLTQFATIVAYGGSCSPSASSRASFQPAAHCASSQMSHCGSISHFSHNRRSTLNNLAIDLRRDEQPLR